MANPAENDIYIEAALDKRRDVGVPQAVKRDGRPLLQAHKPGPIAAKLTGAERLGIQI